MKIEDFKRVLEIFQRYTEVIEIHSEHDELFMGFDDDWERLTPEEINELESLGVHKDETSGQGFYMYT